MTPLLKSLLAGGACVCAGSAVTLTAQHVVHHHKHKKPAIVAVVPKPKPALVSSIPECLPAVKVQESALFNYPNPGINVTDEPPIYGGGGNTGGGGGTVSAPEAPSFALLGVGLMALAAVRWKS